MEVTLNGNLFIELESGSHLAIKYTDDVSDFLDNLDTDQIINAHNDDVLSFLKSQEDNLILSIVDFDEMSIKEIEQYVDDFNINDIDKVSILIDGMIDDNESAFYM